MPARSRPRRGYGRLESDVLGALSVGAVQQVIGADLAHTTVHTILTRLCEKGAVARDQTGRGHAYRPVLAEPDLAARQMRRLLDREADRGAVLSRFVTELSPADETVVLAALRQPRGNAPGGESSTDAR